MVMPVTFPKPSRGFHWTQLAAGPALVCEALTPFAAHFFTTRGWQLGARTPGAPGGTDSTGSVAGWNEIASAARVDAAHLGRLRQVHGADVATYRKGASVAGAAPQADIVLTDDPSMAVAIQTADCVPILIADRRTRAVAAAHAGWRGLAARVPAIAIERMVRDAGSDVNDLVVAVGPAIGACCYEVGADVRARFAEEDYSSPQLARWFRSAPSLLIGNPPMPSLATARRPDHWFFDGWSCVREQLESAGVPGDQIFIAELCTASHEASFCSYRRDGTAAGRLAAVIRRQNLEVRS